MYRIIVRKTVIAMSVLLALAVGLVVPSSAGAAVAKPPPPTIDSFLASPISAYGYLGGPVALTASVTNASTCTLSVNHFVSGLPATVDCSSGTVTEALTLPARGSGRKPATYNFKLRAVGSKSVTGKVSVTVASHYDGCLVFFHRGYPPAPYLGCNLAGADLSNWNLLFIPDFQEANLTHVNLTNDNLSNVSFSVANLSFANLSGANLTGSFSLTIANLTGVIWSDTTCPDGTNSDNDGGTCVNNLG